MAQLPLDLGHRTALDQADFLVAPPNAVAVGWLDRWPDWDAPALALAGPPGSGKTHLVHVFKARAGAVLMAGRDLATARLPILLGAARAAAVDDADAADEEALLHLYNVLVERRGHLLLAAREVPGRWGIALADLRSRLLAAPVATVGPPDDTLLAAVLVKLFADRQLAVDDEIVAYLVTRIERSFAAAAQVVAALDGAALAAKRRRVTIPIARAALDDP